MSRESIQAEVSAERDRQTDIGWTQEHDDSHDEIVWTALLVAQLGKAADRAGQVQTYRILDSPYSAKGVRRSWRRELVQLAAVCIAAVEAHDRRDDA